MVKTKWLTYTIQTNKTTKIAVNLKFTAIFYLARFLLVYKDVRFYLKLRRIIL